MNRIDQLFKNKLAEQRLAPPPQSWEKIEARRAKKNSFLAWRIAAGLAVFGLLASAWYWNNSTDTNSTIAEEVQPTIDATPKQIEKLQQPELSAEKTNVVALKKNRNKKVPEHVTEEPAQAVVEVSIPEISLETMLALENTVSVVEPEKPIVIEFVLEPVSKNATVVQTTPDESGIKKILDKALEIKNGESDFGSLRNAKNELFALDFRKEKTKRN